MIKKLPMESIIEVYREKKKQKKPQTLLNSKIISVIVVVSYPSGWNLSGWVYKGDFSLYMSFFVCVHASFLILFC